MSQPANSNPFEPFFQAIREIVREEIAAALQKKAPIKLQFTTREASAMLSVKDSWLTSKARAGEVPYHRQGHKVFFTQQDIDEIQAQSAVHGKNGKD